MHLAIVTPFPPSITGIGQYGYHVTRALAHSGMFTRLTVLAGSRIGGNSPNHLGLTEVEYCWQPNQLNARQAVMSRVRRLRPDLVWFNLGASVFGRSPLANLSGMLTPMLVRGMGIPTVVTLHELMELADLRTLDAPGGALAPLGARLLTKVVTQSDLVVVTLQRFADWLSARQIDCARIPIGAYHTPEFLPESDSQELLFFTTLAPFKGLELLLHAFPSLREEFPKLKLTIAGTEHIRFPEYARALKSRFGEMDGVGWPGQVDEDRVQELFRRAQIVILPYAASTGSSSVLYQAATWGRAVVASDLAETRSLARENNLCVEFFENGNADSLRDAIRSMLCSDARRRAQVENNFAFIQHARPEETCLRYAEAFNRALAKHQRAQRLPLARVELSQR